MFLKEAIGKNLTFKNAKKNYVLVPYLGWASQHRQGYSFSLNFFLILREREQEMLAEWMYV